jgi:hypothetical protein
MAGWSEDLVMTIGLFNSNSNLVDRTWIIWRPSGALRWKVETTGRDGRGMIHEKPTPPRL